MKNVHVIPTSNPSKIFYIAENFHLEKGQLIEPKSYHNVYITSDEEIKEGDWVLYHEDKISQVLGINIDELKLDRGGVWRSSCKKIILTTDQDLIKDGVQSIDDEFLEWFIDNPSCEFVKVNDLYSYTNDNTEYIGYKIIIPQEEPKQDYNGVHLRHCYQGEYEDGCKYGENDCPAKPKEENKQSVEEYEQQGLEKYLHESKQERVQEVAENKYTKGVYIINGIDICESSRECFIEGAKWESERRYSLDEIKTAMKDGYGIKYFSEHKFLENLKQLKTK
jgi:hypothetical protein